MPTTRTSDREVEDVYMAWWDNEDDVIKRWDETLDIVLVSSGLETTRTERTEP